MWARLAKGVIGTDNVDAQLGDGLPAEVVLGLTTRRDRRLRPRRRDRACSVPTSRKSCRSSSSASGGPRASWAFRSSTSRPWTMASRSTRPRPCARCPASRSARTRSHESQGVRRRSHRSRRRRPRPRRRSRSRPTRPCARPLRSPPCPTCASFPALRRGNVHGALGAGLAPGFLPGRVTLDDGREWFTEHWGAAPRRPRARRRRASSRAAADGKIHVLVLLGADPALRLPRRGPRQARRSTVPAS